MGCGASSPPPQQAQSHPRQTAAVKPVQTPAYNAQHPSGTYPVAPQAGTQAQAAPASYNTHNQPPTQPGYPSQQGQATYGAPAPPANTNQQVQPMPNDDDDEQTEIAVRDIETTKGLLQQYVNIEKEVIRLESESPIQTYNAAMREYNHYVEAVKTAEANYAKAVAACKKEKKDFDDLKDYSGELPLGMSQEQFTNDLSKEEREWLEAKGEQEKVQRELEQVKQMKDKASEVLKPLETKMETINNKYKEQEELLAAIFKGKYGSDQENRLEAEYDYLMDRTQRVGAAKYKWTNGKNLLQHATSQLCMACKKWMEIISMNPQDQQGRYKVITESRNNIIAAAQNITSAQKYLNSIEFPYCKPKEVQTLETAAANVYTDMLSQERHRYVYANVYLSMYKRCKALVEWFSHVLEETIAKDHAEAATASKAKGKELQQERLSLITEKIRTELQQEVTFEVREEEVAEKQPEEELAPAFETGEEGGSGGEDPPEGEVEAEEPFNPVPLKELVSSPNKEDLFGDAQELYKKHQEDLAELEKNQMLNKTRQEQGLEEKLRARRSRRQREAAIQAEMAIQREATSAQ